MIENLSFEELIIWACKSQESSLRIELLKVLKEFGYEIHKDSYSSYKDPGNSIYNNVLFIRGKPNCSFICHTDICRDYVAINSDSPEPEPTPVIKNMNGERILQDYNCKTQIGGDDRLGVAIAVWTLLQSKNDCALLLTTDEEIGLRSSYELDIPKINDFELLIQIDRGNQSNQIVNEIGGLELCNSLMSETLKLITSKRIPRTLVKGAPTDIYALKKQNKIQNAVNITCGYHNSFGQSGHEYINIREAKETLFLIKDILEYFT